MGFLGIFQDKARQKDLDQLADTVKDLQEEVDDHDQDLDQLLEMIQELKEAQKQQGERLETVEEDTKRMDQVIEELREEVLQEEQIDLQPMEQEIFKVLMKAERPLKYKEIGQRMEKERSADQVRPKLISLKDKVTILEDKDGRAKVFSIPKKTKKNYIEKGEIAEIEEEL